MSQSELTHMYNLHGSNKNSKEFKQILREVNFRNRGSHAFDSGSGGRFADLFPDELKHKYNIAASDPHSEEAQALVAEDHYRKQMRNSPPPPSVSPKAASEHNRGRKRVRGVRDGRGVKGRMVSRQGERGPYAAGAGRVMTGGRGQGGAGTGTGRVMTGGRGHGRLGSSGTGATGSGRGRAEMGRGAAGHGQGATGATGQGHADSSTDHNRQGELGGLWASEINKPPESHYL